MHLLAEGRFSDSIVEQSTDSTVSDICLMRSNWLVLSGLIQRLLRIVAKKLNTADIFGC